MRRFLMLLAASATMLVVFASSAMAQQYPPAPGPAEGLTPGSAPPGARGAAGGELAFTGSDLLPLIWIGLAVLVLGVTLVVAARRRSAIRGRRVSEAVA